jgi:hypothetical protein
MKRLLQTALFATVLTVYSLPCPIYSNASTLFEEYFEDTNFASRGWYDNTNIELSTAEHISGSTRSAQFHFLKGATKPTSGSGIRKKIQATESLYISYWVKYSSNYTGSNRPYHPHEFMIMTNKNGDWDGPAYSHLTAYVEQNEFIPRLRLQDGQNINTAKVGANLIGVTESRAVTGCNGDAPGHGSQECYQDGGDWVNGNDWDGSKAYFAPGKWYHVEAYFKMNTVTNGVGQPDGILRYWLDGSKIIEHSNIYFRTGQNADMKFTTFIIAPYIGDGSPVDQTFWVDNLAVKTDVPSTVLPPLPPTGLTVTRGD